MKWNRKPPESLDVRLRWLLWSMLLLVCAAIVGTLAVLLIHNYQYARVSANIVRASQFNQNFREDVDLKMYYYVTGSNYGQALPLQEVKEARVLAQELLADTRDGDSRKAIESAINLCETLSDRIVDISETSGYDARMEQLESNVYILTELVQQYFYEYLYHEAGYLDSLQDTLTMRLWAELGGVVVAAAALLALLGLIPNCSVSVVITESYLAGVLGLGGLFAGLLSNAGIGLLVLFRTNKNPKENLVIVATLYILSALAGIAVTLIGGLF